MKLPPRRCMRRCAKCGRHSDRGHFLRSASVVTVAANWRIPAGTELPAGAWVCWRHWNNATTPPTPNGLRPIGRAVDPSPELVQGDLWQGPGAPTLS